MNRLILQTYYRHDSNKQDNQVGCYIPSDDLAVESEKRFRVYADSIGADYKMINSPPFSDYPQPAWARFQIMWETDYDEVCYIDADILPSKKVLGISIFDWEGVAKKTERDVGARAEWHVNAGVFKLTRKELFKMRPLVFHKPYLRWLIQTGKNQDPFNEMYKKGVGRKPKFLDPRWNCTRPHHNPRWFAHYIGHQKVGKGNQWGCMETCPVYKEQW